MALPKVEVEITADTAGAVAGFERVRRAANENATAFNQASRTVGNHSRQLSRQVRGNNAFGRSVQNMSFQVGDFATQVGAGTSASVALGQQLPQLLGGFGILGAAMGAVVAIGVPLVRVLTDVQKGGKDLSPILGNLAPLARELGSALSVAKDIAVDFAETVINNMDRLLTTAGTVAAFFAGKWVAGIIIAKAATFSFVGALTALKWALVRTGFGIVIVAAGELVYQFSRLVTASGGFGKAFGIVISTAKVLFASLGPFMVQQLGLAVLKIADIFNGSNINKVIQEKFGIDVARELLATAKSAGDAFQEMAGPDKIGAANAAIEKMDALLSSVNSKHISLGDIFGGGKQDGEAANSNDPNAKDDGFAAKLARVQESLMTENELIMAANNERLAIIEEARNRELIGAQEHSTAIAQINQDTADKITAIEAAKRNTMLGQTSSLFGALANLAQAGGKKTAGIAKAFGIAEALINTYVGATNALRTIPFPANFAAAAAVIANGLASVATIAGVNANGGANSASGGGRAGGAAAAAAAPKPLDVMIQGLQPNDLISGGQLSSLFDKLIDEAGDRGIRPMFAA
jgi:hypothetical protein